MTSRQFSLPTVLRMVPNTLLKACFEELGHGQFDPNWAELKKKEIDPILDYLEELPVEQLNEIEGVLRNVFDLGCPSGYDALVEAGPHCGVPDLSSVVPDELRLRAGDVDVAAPSPGVREASWSSEQDAYGCLWRKRSFSEPEMAPEPWNWATHSTLPSNCGSL